MKLPLNIYVRTYFHKKFNVSVLDWGPLYRVRTLCILDLDVTKWRVLGFTRRLSYSWVKLSGLEG
jgi:hypothetical protein